MNQNMVSKTDAWKLDSSMFVIEGSWETGYLLNDELILLTGVTTCEVGSTCDLPLPGSYQWVKNETQELAESSSFWLSRVAAYLRSAAADLELGRDTSENRAQALRCLAKHYSITL
jgi:cell division FtsZ-interacting protein ZapD